MEKMRFEQFTNAVVEKIREYLPESFANAVVDLQTVVKNNDLKLTGLTIRTQSSNISPTIYLEQFFERYQNGEEMSKVLEHIADLRIRHEVRDTFDIKQITDFEQVKDRIVPRVVGKKWNEELLKVRPYTDISDLAVTYHILLDDKIEGTASVAITNTLMKSWGTETEELHSLALKNLPLLLPGTFQSMSSVLSALIVGGLDDEEAAMMPQDDLMFVLSNKQRMFGASAILDKDFMNEVIEKFMETGRNFILLPSSVHDWIIVSSDSEYMDTAQLTEMIQDVNAGQVAPEERLSDHPYKYTTEDGLIFA
ncbi:MAG: DUF5688 family protein [Lachnospiraceae bacterium]|nr:DUF5688 family protein [Lachnospiraceae bacterium]